MSLPNHAWNILYKAEDTGLADTANAVPVNKRRVNILKNASHTDRSLHTSMQSQHAMHSCIQSSAVAAARHALMAPWRVQSIQCINLIDLSMYKNVLFPLFAHCYTSLEELTLALWYD